MSSIEEEIANNPELANEEIIDLEELRELDDELLGEDQSSADSDFNIEEHRQKEEKLKKLLKEEGVVVSDEEEQDCCNQHSCMQLARQVDEYICITMCRDCKCEDATERTQLLAELLCDLYTFDGFHDADESDSDCSNAE